MALNAYLQLTGQQQGPILGGAPQPERLGTIEVNAFSQSVAAPTNRKGAQSPFAITMAIDVATPLLHNALVNDEPITDWMLRCYRPAETGEKTLYFTIELVDARVASIDTEMLNNRYPENASLDQREHVAFTYRKIVRTWVETGVTAEAVAQF